MSRVTFDEFVERSRACFGDVYDYSKVVFENTSTPVEIVCPKHGSFWQTPSKHMHGRGCPNKECVVARRQKTMLERYGSTSALGSPEILERLHQTMLSRYGAENPMQVAEFRAAHAQTCMERFGTDTPLSSPEVRDKILKTMVQEYGGRGAMCDAKVRAKSVATSLAKYGVKNPMQCSSVAAHQQDSLEAAVGVRNPMFLRTNVHKVAASKIANGTVNTSMPEDRLYELLCGRFGKDDVIRQYMSDLYPHACDFYIKSRDMYIELNATWTHGGGWFDDRIDDVQLNRWIERAKSSEYYSNALYVWTKSDVIKRENAMRAGLNYVVFWDNSLRDAMVWFENGCPDRRDYGEKCLYNEPVV